MEQAHKHSIYKPWHKPYVDFLQMGTKFFCIFEKTKYNFNLLITQFRILICLHGMLTGCHRDGQRYEEGSVIKENCNSW